MFQEPSGYVTERVARGPQPQVPHKRWDQHRLEEPSSVRSSPLSHSLAGRVAWFHPPKTGSSLGNVLLHAASALLPPCARMGQCTNLPFAPRGNRSFALNHPYEPHWCSGATDYLFLRFPPDLWFDRSESGSIGSVPRRTPSFWLENDFGAHASVSQRTFAEYKGAFHGLFRAPHKLLPSNYFRCLDNAVMAPLALTPTPEVIGPELRTNPKFYYFWRCLDWLGVSGELRRSKLLGRRLHNFTSGDEWAAAAFLRYAQGRQGHVSTMLSNELRDTPYGCGCGGRLKYEVGPPSKKATAVAISRLDGFKFVGLTDEWERSVCLFHRMHGDRPCKPAELVNSRPTASPTGRRRVSGRSRAPDYEAFFHERGFVDRADGALFAAARERFERDVLRYNVSDESCALLGCVADRHKAKCTRAVHA